MKKISTCFLMVFLPLLLMGFEFQFSPASSSSFLMRAALSSNTKGQKSLTRGTMFTATSQLRDSYFSETTILLIDHTPEGSMGVVISRPTTVLLSDLWPQIKALQGSRELLFLGGPVDRDRVLLLLQTPTPPEDAFHVFANVYFAPSQHLFQQVIETPQSQERFRVYAGYAGWSPGQLQYEISRGDWQIIPTDPELVFQSVLPPLKSKPERHGLID